MKSGYAEINPSKVVASFVISFFSFLFFGVLGGSKCLLKDPLLLTPFSFPQIPFFLNMEIRQWKWDGV